MHGPLEATEKYLQRFRHVTDPRRRTYAAMGRAILTQPGGIAFQILNDLKDFEADGDNKIIAGQDVLASRPTVLLALALETLPAPRREELLSLVSQGEAPDAERVARVKYLYDLAGVFDKAERLVDKFRAKAEDLADSVTPEELRHLLLYLVDSVLDGSSHVVPEPEEQSHKQAGGLLSLPVA